MRDGNRIDRLYTHARPDTQRAVWETHALGIAPGFMGSLAVRLPKAAQNKAECEPAWLPLVALKKHASTLSRRTASAGRAEEDLGELSVSVSRDAPDVAAHPAAEGVCVRQNSQPGEQLRAAEAHARARVNAPILSATAGTGHHGAATITMHATPWRQDEDSERSSHDSSEQHDEQHEAGTPRALSEEETASAEARALFSGMISDDEQLIADFGCAMRQTILIQGRLFVFQARPLLPGLTVHQRCAADTHLHLYSGWQRHLAFHANVFGAFTTKLVVRPVANMSWLMC